MPKQTASCTYVRYTGPVIRAKREIPYELQVSARLIMDELCYKWNKNQLEAAINDAIDSGDRNMFLELGEQYKPYRYE
ncbi:IDEAL domain-containing protein [Lentibacillus saliphilus]|uniref:IDEAL domain-containing protein n=1 Tax=Lentibacillus saliphilus TaxID=2737028 RepID=UPI001C30DC16|nr:IDEAL domain-containing protein [Lentibacillus saliphilus]